jgi:hypothetical protein
MLSNPDYKRAKAFCQEVFIDRQKKHITQVRQTRKRIKPAKAESIE